MKIIPTGKSKCCCGGGGGGNSCQSCPDENWCSNCLPDSLYITATGLESPLNCYNGTFLLCGSGNLDFNTSCSYYGGWRSTSPCDFENTVWIRCEDTGIWTMSITFLVPGGTATVTAIKLRTPSSPLPNGLWSNVIWDGTDYGGAFEISLPDGWNISDNCGCNSNCSGSAVVVCREAYGQLIYDLGIIDVCEGVGTNCCVPVMPPYPTEAGETHILPCVSRQGYKGFGIWLWESRVTPGFWVMSQMYASNCCGGATPPDYEGTAFLEMAIIETKC